jgi:hypothetical protein
VIVIAAENSAWPEGTKTARWVVPLRQPASEELAHGVGDATAQEHGRRVCVDATPSLAVRIARAQPVLLGDRAVMRSTIDSWCVMCTIRIGVVNMYNRPVEAECASPLPTGRGSIRCAASSTRPKRDVPARPDAAGDSRL